jgi:CBS domain-containing protein
MKIKEVMTRDVTSISPQISAKEALDLLLKMEISGLPVIDEKNKLVGMFTEKDILRNVLPSYIEKVGRFVYEENPKLIEKKFQYLKDLSVSKLMCKDVVTVDENTSLCEVARLMLTQKVRRIPVLDKEKKVVGIVAREDIVRAYAREAGWVID